MDMISGNYNSSISSSPSISSSSSSKKCFPSADSRRTSSSACIFPKPPWLLSTLHDLEGRMKTLSLIRNIDKEKDEINIAEEEVEAENTFSERAEIYYLKRPQLLNLLHDLYNNYLSLSDRYCQTITKINRDIVDISTNDYESDVESSLSHQSPSSSLDMDMIMAELVMRMVENDVIVQELNITEKKWGESLRKTELQTSLLEVLESERLILLSENSRICVRANAMASEANHRMYMLSRRIEDLQEQIRNLQGQLTSGDRLMVMINHQYHNDQSPNYYQKGSGLGWKLENEKMSVFPDYEGTASTSCSSSSNIGMINGGKKKRKMMLKKKKKEIGSWWNRVMNFEMLLCGIHDDST
ncbi:kinase-interacting family protein-like [Impatiens glandulifera]|uniref:kinase-interacting family protein-like n=1 Tax=Impatiens glandulifera TaxID=253017 RepID=UPI001FB08661|nr:kinase-interacting family protein-like [Impatiens glandulifera]